MKASTKEWSLVFMVSTLLLVWTTLPNWLGHALQDETLSYVGTYFDAIDYSVHVTMMRAGMQGDWGYEFRFTTEPHQPQYIRLFYIALGQLNRILRIEPETLFHIARWLLGYCALFALYRLFTRIFTSQPSRWIAFILAVAGAGFGILQLFFGLASGPNPPVDLWLIDAYMLFSLALFPHFAFTLALILLALTAWLDFLRTRKFVQVFVVILSALLVQCVNPIAFALADVMMAAVTVLRWWMGPRVIWREAAALMLVAAAQIPLLLYNFLLLNNDPVWSQFTAQNETLSPPPISYLWGFGLFWGLSVAGFVRAVRERKDNGPVFIAAGLWIAAAFGFAYIPFAIQRRFLLGVTIPFAILSAYSLEWVTDQLARRLDKSRRQFSPGIILSIALMCLTTIFLTPGYMLYLQNRPAEFFYPHALDPAFGWINTNTAPDDFFLGTDDTGRLLAQKTGRPVYLGHPMETLRYTEKVELVNAYFAGEMPDDWLSALPIHWVVYGPYEKALAPNFRPGPDLVPAYTSETVTVYHVR